MDAITQNASSEYAFIHRRLKESCCRHHDRASSMHDELVRLICRVFGAKAPTAKVTVMDWKSHSEPGRRIGQRLIDNLAGQGAMIVEAQFRFGIPYLATEEKK